MNSVDHIETFKLYQQQKGNKAHKYHNNLSVDWTVHKQR